MMILDTQRRRSHERRRLSKRAFNDVCGCCGYDEHVDILEFHHVDPLEKIHNIATMIVTNCSWRLIVEELRKCVLLCPTCHTEVQKGYREIPDFIRRFDESYATYENQGGTTIGLIPWDREKTCPTCGLPFQARRKSHKYCCQKCKWKRGL